MSQEFSQTSAIAVDSEVNFTLSHNFFVKSCTVSQELLQNLSERFPKLPLKYF